MPRILAGLCLFLALLAAPTFARAQTAAEAVAEVSVSILDIGQGDAILIRSPEGKSALIDAGPSNHVVKLLRERGVTALDLVILSHHHADHYGGMAEAIKAFHPRFFLASTSAHTSPHYLKLLELVRDQGITALQVEAVERKIALGSVVLTVLPQAPEDPREENNNSVGVRLQYGGFSVLFPGDAEKTERDWWEKTVPNLCADCTVLKLAHHGSKNGTDARWLDLVHPQLAVASLGAENSFGHPHAETLALLARDKVPLLRTDVDGTVLIESDGRHYRVFHEPSKEAADPAKSKPKSPKHRTPRHEGVAAPRTGRIDVNSATLEQLESLPGIGPVFAKRIIAGRPYATIDDLRRIQGIGEKRLADIRALISAR